MAGLGEPRIPVERQRIHAAQGKPRHAVGCHHYARRAAWLAPALDSVVAPRGSDVAVRARRHFGVVAVVGGGALEDGNHEEGAPGVSEACHLVVGLVASQEPESSKDNAPAFTGILPRQETAELAVVYRPQVYRSAIDAAPVGAKAWTRDIHKARNWSNYA